MCSGQSFILNKYNYTLVSAKTVKLPSIIKDCPEHTKIGKEMIKIWKEEGIFQVKLENDKQEKIMQNALAQTKKFFGDYSLEQKRSFVSKYTYSGYTGSLEEVTGIYKDTPEVFTIFEDVSTNDERFKKKYPIHGPVPWPFNDFKLAYEEYINMILGLGNRVLQLISLGLNLERMDILLDITHNGCYNLRILKYPQAKNGEFRGVGAHSDYGFLSLGNQTSEGILIRPPIEGEVRGKNWIKGLSGKYDEEEPWNMVKCESDGITVYPGDMFQLLTNGYIMPTIHKVIMNPNEERFSTAFFHEPNFDATLVPLMGDSKEDHFHFGTHVTNMYVANCPNRITTKYLKESGGYEMLKALADKSYNEMKKNESMNTKKL